MENEDNIDELEQQDEQAMERDDQAEHPVPPDLATVLRDTRPVPRKRKTPRIHVGDTFFDYTTNTTTTIWKEGFGPRNEVNPTVGPRTKKNEWSNVQHWQYIVGYSCHGTNWSEISKRFVPTKNREQLERHHRTNKKHPHPGGDDVEMAVKILRDLGKLPPAYDYCKKIEKHSKQNERHDDGPDNAGSFGSLNPGLRA